VRFLFRHFDFNINITGNTTTTTTNTTTTGIGATAMKINTSVVGKLNTCNKNFTDSYYASMQR